MGRQLSPNRLALISTAVTMGATVVASMVSPPSIPATAVRSSALYSSCTTDSTWGTISAAAAPCTSRAAISASGLHAAPTSTEASPKAVTPARKSRR